MKLINPSRIEGRIEARPSKSLMQRAVAASLLAEGTSIIRNPSFCDDSIAALGIAEKMGARISKGHKKIKILGIDIQKKLKSKKLILDCKESGLCMRMFSPIAALLDCKTMLTGNGSLLARPISMIEKPLIRLGAECKTNKGFPPVKITGPIKGGQIIVDGSTSSQFLTGLLIALPLCENDSAIAVSELKSKPYIEMTCDVLEKFGIQVKHDKDFGNFKIEGRQKYKACNLKVENDWSSAAFLLVAGAIAGKVEVNGLSLDSLQADKEIINALKAANAKLKAGKNSISAETNELRGFKFDISECPDLFPSLAVLACNCKGKSSIYGIERLKHKESNRAAVMASELKKMGGNIKVFENHAEIMGNKLHGCTIDSHNDHRIAMACAIAALSSEKAVKISGENCISKSYPEFFIDLKKIGADIT